MRKGSSIDIQGKIFKRRWKPSAKDDNMIHNWCILLHIVWLQMLFYTVIQIMSGESIFGRDFSNKCSFISIYMMLSCLSYSLAHFNRKTSIRTRHQHWYFCLITLKKLWKLVDFCRTSRAEKLARNDSKLLS